MKKKFLGMMLVGCVVVGMVVLGGEVLAVGSSTKQQRIFQAVTTKATLLGVGNNFSMYYKGLKDGVEVTINADRPWVPASMVKCFLIVEAFRQRNAGLINFDQKIVIKSKNVVPSGPETYDFSELQAGTRITIRELVEVMITRSDNTAYNALLDLLDRRNVNLTLKRLEFLDTSVGEKLSLGDVQAGLEADLPGKQVNQTTAHDLGLLFEKLYNGQIKSGGEILNVFKRQRESLMLPALLPSVPVAHKTGVSAPYYHDGGIVYKPYDPYVLVIMTDSGNPDIVAKLSKEVYYVNDRKVLGSWTTDLWNIIQSFISSLGR